MSRAQLTSTVEQNTGGAVAPVVAGKNFLINGAMELAQRGTSQSLGTGNAYGLDRWFTTGFGSGQAFTVAQGTSNPPTGFRYYQSITQSSASSTNYFIAQFLETSDVLRMAGKTVTLSYLYKIPTNFSSAWTVTAYYSTATDGNLAPYNTRTSIASSTLTNTTSWTAGNPLTFTVPSNATSFSIEFGNSNSTVNGANFQFTGVQLELGSVATPFSRTGATLQGELALCQRYYYKSITGIAGAAAYTGITRGIANYNGARTSLSAWLPVTMRTTPSATIYSPQTGASGKIYDEDSSTDVSATIYGSYPAVISQVDTGVSAGHSVVAYFIASAEL